jgi:hypothetical protein
MKDAGTYRQYAAECRRIAQTMNGEDRATMMQMAELWESTAREADRVAAKQRQSGDQLTAVDRSIISDVQPHDNRQQNDHE